MGLFHFYKNVGTELQPNCSAVYFVRSEFAFASRLFFNEHRLDARLLFLMLFNRST